MAGAGPSTVHVPPLPKKLRAEPHEEEIGPGKPYADAAAFNADHSRWEQERDARVQRMAERQRAQKKLHEQERDRSARQRPADDGMRREQQRQQQQSAVRMESLTTPTFKLFFLLANLTRMVVEESASGVKERLWSVWEGLLGRRPPLSATVDYVAIDNPRLTLGNRILDDNLQSSQRVAKLLEAGVDRDDLLRTSKIDFVFIGRPYGESGRGACVQLYTDNAGSPSRVECYDGQWVWNGSRHNFTGRGHAKFSDGEYSNGVWFEYRLMQGIRVRNGQEEVVERSERAKNFIKLGQPAMANFVDLDHKNEEEEMEEWLCTFVFNDDGRKLDDCELTDALLLEWRASSEYRDFRAFHEVYTKPLWCVSEELYRTLSEDVIVKNNLTCAGFPQLPYEFARDALSNHLRASHSQAQELKAMRAEHERLKYKIPGIEFWEGLYQKYSPAERRRLYATNYEELLEGSRLTRDGHDQASELPAMYASKERLAGQIDRLSEKIAGQIWPQLKAMSPFEVLMNAPLYKCDDSNYDEITLQRFARQERCSQIIYN